MTTWYQRMMPYPLLAPWTEDYGDATFGVDVPEAVLNNGREIKVSLEFRLSSDTLANLVLNDGARYAVEVSSPRTFVRSTHPAFQQDELALDAGDYSDEVLLTPYIHATDPIEEFTSPEHAQEWRDHRREGFSIPAAGILAVGNTTRVILEDSGVSSVIDLIANPNVPDGTFDVQLDEDRIKIHVPDAEKEKIEAVRRSRGSNVEFAALFPAIYLHAVTEALRELTEHDGSRWAFTIRNALDRADLGDVDEGLLRENALRYAQVLMEQPVGSFLTAAMNTEEEE